MKSMLKSLMSVAVAALAFTSCSNDATDEVIAKGELKTLEVNATIDQTRTTLDNDHVNLTWATDDQIHLYIGADATEAKSINPKTDGKITGVTYKDADKVYAYYSLPESGKSSSGADNVLINIVQDQTQSTPDVFEGKNMPMVASGEIKGGKVSLAFQPIGCVLVFNVYGQGKNADEKIKSIKFETSTGCYGYDYLNLIENSKYEAYNSAKDKSVTVTLTEGAPIVAAKPADNTHLGGGNQVYLVVAPVNYPAGSKFTVTTDATENNTYTFTTTTALDCSTSTARVVNLNLSKSAEIKPAIGVPDVPRQGSTGSTNLTIDPITFTNITNEQIAAAKVGVFSDEALTQPLENSWITIHDNNATLLPSGQLECTVAENTTTAERTAYIGIKCFEGAQVIAQAAIAITQVAKGAVIPDPTEANVNDIVTSSSYKEYANDNWIVTFGGNNHTLGSNSGSVSKCKLTNYSKVAEAMGITVDDTAAAVISKVALPAGYNTATLQYSRTNKTMQVGIAFSPDNVNWRRIKDLTELTESKNPGSVEYSFAKQDAGYYAFVMVSTASEPRIQTCVITYSQK